MSKYSFVTKSANSKTGPIPVTYSPRNTCPPTCALKNGPCYGDSGNVRLNWDAISRGDRGIAWESLCSQVALLPARTLWRHDVVGDLPHVRGRINRGMLKQLTTANSHKCGFTYTHHAVLGSRPHAVANRQAIADANASGFTISLSANNLQHADQLADLHVAPIVTLLPRDTDHTYPLYTPRGRRVIVCPAVHRDDVTCATCGLCQIMSRKVIIGFPAHASGAKRVDEIFVSFK